MNSGEYAHPLSRTTEAQAPVVAGIKTIRLRANGTLPQDASDQLATTKVMVINTGSTGVTVQLVESDDYIGGPFTNLGSNLHVDPHGQRTEVVYPRRKYLEVLGTTGTGEVKVSLSSQIRYERLAFEKLDAQYPQGIVSANIPGWSTL